MSKKNGTACKASNKFDIREIWLFDGQSFTKTEVKWAPFPANGQGMSCETWRGIEEEFLSGEGWESCSPVYLSSPRDWRSMRDDWESHIESMPIYRHDDGRFLIQYSKADSHGFDVIVPDEIRLMDLLSRWAPVLSLELLHDSMRDLVDMVGRVFEALHGHNPDDRCQQCASCSTEHDVRKHTLPADTLIRLQEPLETHGGTKFKVGEKLRVSQCYSGRGVLCDPSKPERAINNIDFRKLKYSLV